LTLYERVYVAVPVRSCRRFSEVTPGRHLSKTQAVYLITGFVPSCASTKHQIEPHPSIISGTYRVAIAMEGYAKVAQLMSTHPEFAIFRRFRALNVQNLLYMQAEITHLEAELRNKADEDIQSGNKQDHAHDWWSLAQDQETDDAGQWETVLEIREKLEKYSM
jgi:hypothetical protein